MAWVLLVPLGVQIASELHLDAGQKGLMVAVLILAGALLRVVNGVLVDRIGPKRTDIIGQSIVPADLLIAWLHGVGSCKQVLLLGVVLVWYGLMVVLLAVKASPHTVNSISAYRTLYHDAAGLTASDFTTARRLIAEAF